MLQALLAGVASIKSQQTRMNVIGNNLANVNTIAYKGSRVTFQDMLAQTVRGAQRPNAGRGGTNAIQYGLGVLVAGTDTNNEQGSLNATNRPTDLAIQGNGYFMVSNGDRLAYTRDGGFDLDASGDLVHRATGERVMGWKADSLGTIDSSTPIGRTSSLNIPLGSLNAVQVTSRVSYAGNLSGDATPTDAWTAQVRTYDSLGGAHDLTIQYTNRQVPAIGTPPAGATSSWDWNVYEGSVATGTLLGGSNTAGNVPLYFNNNGQAIAPASGVLNQITVGSSNGAPSFPVQMDFAQITQLKGQTQVNAKDQNGFPPGSLSGFSVGNDGVVTGLFTNGLTRPLGQVAMSIFSNPQGLERMGNNLWRATDNSGIPVTGQANNGGRGQISSGFLEQSNVDIGNEFTDLIVTQRGFQANTKVVTTVDEMLQDLINMKR